MFQSSLYANVLLLVALLAWANSVELPFSGVYQSNSVFQPERSIGAFLISKHRFLTTETTKEWQTEIIENTSESTISAFLKGTCPTCINLFSRDFLDFFTENLSSAITQLKPSQREVVNYYARGMKKNIKYLQKVAHSAHRCIDSAATNTTLAIVLFNGDMANRVSGRMKLLLFQSTFWSVYRHFGSVLVMTKSAADRDAVRALSLPAMEVVNLDLRANFSRNLDYNTKMEIMHAELVKHSLQVTAQRWRSDMAWTRSGFAHLYFSQGDQLLHARRLGDIYRAMSMEQEGNFAAMPHAMQTLTLAQSLPRSIQTLLWPQPSNTTAQTPAEGAWMSTASSARRSSIRREPQQSPQWLPDARIFAESADTVTGSCCEQGRFIFPECVSIGSSSHLAMRAGDAGDGAKLHQLYGEPDVAQTHSIERKVAHRATSVLYATDTSAVPWTACPLWGPRNFSDWIALGKAGFTMPTVTTGLAYCQYSPTAVRCPLSDTIANTAGSCSSSETSRMPSKVHAPSSSSSSGGVFAVCPETPLVRVNKFALDKLSKENALRLLQTNEIETPAVHIAHWSPQPPDLLHGSHVTLSSPQKPMSVPAAGASTLIAQHELPSGLHRRRSQRDHRSSEN